MVGKIDLVPELEAYLAAFESFSSPFRTYPSLSWAAAENPLGATIHLGFNAPGYILAGELMRDMQELPERILDIGCGTGYDLSYVRDRFAPDSSCTGIDADPKLKQYANSHYAAPGLHFETANACRLPFEDNSFDMALSVLCAVHTMSLSDATVCLKEVSRILSPGGMFVFVVLHREVSQDYYHRNVENKPKLMFSRLKHDYCRQDLLNLLEPLASGAEPYFTDFEIGSITNDAFLPVWKDVVRDLSRRRFQSGWGGRMLSYLARKLPARLTAPHFYSLVSNACSMHDVDLHDIVQHARYHEACEESSADLFAVIVHK